jgi:hypothetical protein
MWGQKFGSWVSPEIFYKLNPIKFATAPSPIVHCRFQEENAMIDAILRGNRGFGINRLAYLLKCI